MEFNKKGTKEEILYWSKRLYQKNMCPSRSGNVSIRTPDGILISASGVCLNDMSEDDIILIDYDGNVLDGAKKPSSEKIMHSEIYTIRDDINAIIHCHDPYLTAFAVAGVPITKPILPDFALMYDSIPLVKYYCPSTLDLAVEVGKTFEKTNVALLKNHGVILGSDSLQDAFYELECLKSYVEIYFGAEILGGAKSLTKNNVAEIKKLYSKK